MITTMEDLENFSRTARCFGVYSNINLPQTKATKYNPIVEAATTKRIAVYTAKLGENDNTVPETPLTATAINRAG